MGFVVFPHELKDLQLDIVGFLAILGEGSVLANSQVQSLSKWMFVPRLIPAPQALMKPTRPSRLEQSQGYVTAVHSGNGANQVNHIGNLVLDAESMLPFSVRCVTIKRRKNAPDVKAKTLAPLTFVAALGATSSAILLGISIWQKDGAGLLAICLLSCLSFLIGLGNKSSLKLPTRKADTGKVPPGDVVIRYPKGSFLVVRCSEDVARELYFAPETIDYMIQNPQIYRLISLVGTMMLMLGVIALGNAKVEVQLGFAAAYMSLNAAYWIVAALPSKLHWETSIFEVKLHRFQDDSPGAADEKRFASKSETFTQALWKVLVVTKDWEWVRRGNAAPMTPAWDEWLRDACEVARDFNHVIVDSEADDHRGVRQKVTTFKIPPKGHFDPQAHLNKLISKYQAKEDAAANTTTFTFSSRGSTKLGDIHEASRRISMSQEDHKTIPLGKD